MKPYEIIQLELDYAYNKHGRDPWGRHEFYGILKEEVDELWDEIKNDSPIERVLEELVQVAAVCIRYMETGDRYWGPHKVPPMWITQWADKNGLESSQETSS